MNRPVSRMAVSRTPCNGSPLGDGVRLAGLGPREGPQAPNDAVDPPCALHRVADGFQEVALERLARLAHQLGLEITQVAGQKREWRVHLVGRRGGHESAGVQAVGEQQARLGALLLGEVAHERQDGVVGAGGSSPQRIPTITPLSTAGGVSSEFLPFSVPIKQRTLGSMRRSNFGLALGLAAAACGEAEPVPIEAPPDGSSSGAHADVPSEPVAGDDLLCGPLRADEGNAHVPPGTRVTYATNPPSSGPHYGRWVASGLYDQPVDPRGYVHNLEHGWVVLLYRPDADPAIIETLRAFWRDPPPDPHCSASPTPRIIVTPAPGLEGVVGLAAWRRGYTTDTVTRAILEAFFATCREAAPELAVCADGGPAPFLEPEPAK